MLSLFQCVCVSVSVEVSVFISVSVEVSVFKGFSGRTLRNAFGKKCAQVKVVQPAIGHKWLGCMLTAKESQNAAVTTSERPRRHSMQTNTFWVTREASVVVTPVACFGAGPRAIHTSNFAKINNVQFRKLARSVVGPPAGVDWSQPWHRILHLCGMSVLMHVCFDLGFIVGQKWL